MLIGKNLISVEVEKMRSPYSYWHLTTKFTCSPNGKKFLLMETNPIKNTKALLPRWCCRHCHCHLEPRNKQWTSYTAYPVTLSHGIMMTSSNGNIFRVTGPLCWGIHRSLIDSPPKGHLRGALMFSLICAWTNGWANNRDIGDLRRHRAHFDPIVMVWFVLFCFGTHYFSWISLINSSMLFSVTLLAPGQQ